MVVVEAVNFIKLHLLINTDYYNFTRKLSDGHTAVFVHESTTADTCDSIVMGKPGLSHLTMYLSCQLTLPAGTPHGQELGPRSEYRGADTDADCRAV
jgi:hypothetical protein